MFRDVYSLKRFLLPVLCCAWSFATIGCTQVSVPDARNVDIPAPVAADVRKKAITDRPDSVMYLPLGEDVLVPEIVPDEPLPSDIVGPFELRGETLAGALQLILADYDISLAFETEEGLERRITVANLHGDLNKVVKRVCSLANLYCSFEDNILIVKDTQSFTVTLPPIGAAGEEEDTGFLDDVSQGLAALLGGDGTPIVDPTTRTIVYNATQRTSELASRYFQRLRANTAMIVFETYIWEVTLDSGNSTGIDWDMVETFGKFNVSVGVTGDVGADFSNPVSIGLPTTIGNNINDFVNFLSQFGAVKTISQPQVTVLSGSEAELRVADTQNFVSEITTTVVEGASTTSVSTSAVDTGFTLTIGSAWDNATVYATIDLELTNVNSIEPFSFTSTGDADDTDSRTTIQLPDTSERQITTQIRVRPGDSVLLAGLVREKDNFDSSGPGFMEPVIPTSRTAQASNLELVILLRPRVVVYTPLGEKQKQAPAEAMKSPAASPSPAVSAAPQNSITPPAAASARPPQETAPLVSESQPEPAGRNVYPVAAPAAAPAPYVPPVSSAPPPELYTPPSRTSYDDSTSYAGAPDVYMPPVQNAPEPPPVLLRDPSSEPSVGERYGSGYVSRSPAADSSSSAAPSVSRDDPASYPYGAYESADPVSLYPSESGERESGAPSMYETYDYYTPAY